MLALFQSIAGVSRAISTAPMVEWSCDRIRFVWISSQRSSCTKSILYSHRKSPRASVNGRAQQWSIYIDHRLFHRLQQYLTETELQKLVRVGQNPTHQSSPPPRLPEEVYSETKPPGPASLR